MPKTTSAASAATITAAATPKDWMVRPKFWGRNVIAIRPYALHATAQSLEQQAICAEQAKIALQEYENEIQKKASTNLDQHSDYQSHYNTKLNKCLMEIETTFFDGGHITTSVLLMDAFEQRVYASYIWASQNVNSCDLVPTSQTQTHCSSREEFDAFVAKYMEE